MSINQPETSEENTHSVPAGSLSGGRPVPRRAGVKTCDLVREGSRGFNASDVECHGKRGWWVTQPVLKGLDITPRGFLSVIQERD